MDSSSEDEGVITHRKSAKKTIFESDEEDDEHDNPTEATEDFKLHLSDEDDSDKVDSKEQSEALLPQPDEDSHQRRHVSPDRNSNSSDLRTALTEGHNDNSISPPAMGSSLTNQSSIARGTEDIMRKLNALAGSDSDSDVDGDFDPQKTLKSKSKGGLNSSSDSDSEHSHPELNQNLNSNENDSSKKKKKLGPERKSKTVAKSAMLEIKAESQRQLRQSKIGLPYHIPKQRPLSDFLNRRKSLPNMPVKGPVEQLAVIWKEIEAREKEVEEFYKSESDEDSDSDRDECKSPAVENEGKETCEMVLQESVDPAQSEDVSCNAEQGSSSCVIQSSGDSGVEVQASPADTESNEEANFKPDHCTTVMNVNDDAGTNPIDNGSHGEGIQSSSPLKEGTNETSNVEASSKSGDQLVAEAPSTPVMPILSSEPCSSRGIVSACSQDSQDICLHYSESERLIENDSAGFSSKVTDKLKDSQEGMNSKGIDIPPINGLDSEKTPLEKVNKNSAKTGLNETDKTVINTNNSLTWDELKSKLTFSDEDSEEEDPSAHFKVAKKPVVDSNTRLSLKGSPNDIIDFDNVGPKQSHNTGVKGLIERFMKHSAQKKQPSKPHSVELSVISSEKDTIGGIMDIKHESLKVVLTGDDELHTEPKKPGARLKLLKDELNRQMRKQKEEEWQKKQEEMKNEQSGNAGEKDDCGMLLDDEEEEEEMTDSESESEPEIDDVREPKRKKKSKSMFVDEEAEVEDDDDVASADEGENSDDELSDNVEDDDQDKETEKVSDEESCTAQMDRKQEQEEDQPKVAFKGLPRKMTSDLFSSQSTEWHCGADDDDDFIPAGQPNGVVRQESICDKTDDVGDSTMVFSPMSLSMPIKTPSFLDSNSRETPSKFSWASETQSKAGIKQLFNEPELSTQEKMDDLAALFGGKFNDPDDVLGNLVNTANTADSESDLMALCSGKFITQPPQPKELEGDDTTASQLLSSQFMSQTQDVVESLESRLDAEDSQDFSLKWNEDLVEGPVGHKESTLASKSFDLEIMSSDDDDEFSQIKEKKRKHQKLNFSDEEDENEDEPENQGTDDAVESDNSEEDHNRPQVANKEENRNLFGVFQKTSKEVYYDSDENEIEPGDFFEKEAELSDEEDWQGSEDEDEKGLDQLEMDEADKEDIDQDLVREQLVKNHMQKMLDEDRRDVRILQEMLLEDGELHSDTGGRERQFRWRNVDSQGMEDNGKCSDEENADNEEEEDDAEWRKQRHEREMFLKEQREKMMKDDENPEDTAGILENSDFLQLGKAVLFKSRSNSLDMSGAKEISTSKPVNNQLLSPDSKRPNICLTKRGSFLSRGENVLAKLAKMTGSAKENVAVGAKSSGNFVFTAMSPPKLDSQKEEDSDAKTVKRKATVPISSMKEKKPCLLEPARKRSGLFDHL